MTARDVYSYPFVGGCLCMGLEERKRNGVNELANMLVDGKKYLIKKYIGITVAARDVKEHLVVWNTSQVPHNEPPNSANVRNISHKKIISQYTFLQKWAFAFLQMACMRLLRELLNRHCWLIVAEIMLMSVSGFLFLYALTICNGNKGVLAQKLGIKHGEVCRLLTRFEHGGYSATAMEAVLSMFLRENHSVDDALHVYAKHSGIITEQAVRGAACVNEVFAQRMYAKHQRLRDSKHAASAQYGIVKHAMAFMEYLEKLVCKRGKGEHTKCRICGRNTYFECPCKYFAEYIDMLLEMVGEGIVPA